MNIAMAVVTIGSFRLLILKRRSGILRLIGRLYIDYFDEYTNYIMISKDSRSVYRFLEVVLEINIKGFNSFTMRRLHISKCISTYRLHINQKRITAETSVKAVHN